MFALRGAVSRFFAVDGFFLGAGLAFFTLVTFIPLTLLSVSTLGFLLTSEAAAREVVGHLTRNFPVYHREIRAAVLRIVELRAVSGFVGTAVLIMFSTPLFGACRLVLHRLLNVRAGGSFLGNLATDSVMVVLLGVLLFGATVATWFYHWFEIFVLEPAAPSSAWVHGVGLVFSVALSVSVFYLAYRYVPRRRVRFSAAFAGAIAAGLLWELAKELFAVYIRNVGVYDQIYGPLGVLVAFVMFVYYTAVVFVFGGAWVAALDARRR